MLKRLNLFGNKNKDNNNEVDTVKLETFVDKSSSDTVVARIVKVVNQSINVHPSEEYTNRDTIMGDIQKVAFYIRHNAKYELHNYIANLLTTANDEKQNIEDMLEISNIESLSINDKCILNYNRKLLDSYIACLKHFKDNRLKLNSNVELKDEGDSLSISEKYILAHTENDLNNQFKYSMEICNYLMGTMSRIGLNNIYELSEIFYTGNIDDTVFIFKTLITLLSSIDCLGIVDDKHLDITENKWINVFETPNSDNDLLLVQQNIQIVVVIMRVYMYLISIALNGDLAKGVEDIKEKANLI